MRFTQYKIKLQWSLLLFVVLSLAVYAIYSQLISVIPFYNKYDPEMAYFLNSLGMLSGKPYHFADHPGTPINLAGTLILLLLKPLVALRGQTDFSYYMLLYPQRFLLVARLFISLLHIGGAIFIWRFSKDKVGLAALVLILTSYFVAFGAGIWSTTVHWSHNSVAFALGTSFLFITYQELSSKQPRTYSRLAWLGAGTGFLISIQLYFIAWIIGLLAVVFTLLLIEKQPWWIFLKSGGAIIAGIAASFFLVNSSILHRFGPMFGWFGRVIINLGRYGSGDSGVISLPILWRNFLNYQVGFEFTLLFATVAVLLVSFTVLAIRRRDFTAQKLLWASAVGFSVQVLVACLLILKHPGNFYLVSVAALLPILLFIWFSLQQPRSKWWQIFYTALACLALLVFTVQLINAFRHNDQRKNSLEARSALVDSYLREYAAQHNKIQDELQIFAAYPIVFERCMPLWFGNFWANQSYNGALNNLCPNKRLWNTWDNAFEINGNYIKFEDYDNWDVIIMPSYQTDVVEFFDDKHVTVQQLDYDLTFITP